MAHRPFTASLGLGLVALRAAAAVPATPGPLPTPLPTPLPAGGGGGCSDDEGCSLNGVCSPNGVCVCDPSWRGTSCEVLRLLPAARDSGLRSVDGGRPTSSWGGAVHRQPDGTWGMLAAEMVNHCGIDSWTRNSRVVFATSPTPGGRFTRQSQVEPIFAHEPSVARAPNGSWVMYFARHFPNTTATGGYPPCNCSDGSTPAGSCHSEVGGNQHVTFMATAPALKGPWSEPRMIPLRDCNLQFCQHDMVLAGTILANGTFLGMVKVHHKASEAHLVVAQDWSDASGYVQSANDESGNLFPEASHPPDGGRVEDPSEPWQDARGNWHVLFHAESPSGAPWARSGGHAFSRKGDGRHWTCKTTQDTVPRSQ